MDAPPDREPPVRSREIVTQAPREIRLADGRVELCFFVLYVGGSPLAFRGLGNFNIPGVTRLFRFSRTFLLLADEVL